MVEDCSAVPVSSAPTATRILPIMLLRQRLEGVRLIEDVLVEAHLTMVRPNPSVSPLGRTALIRNERYYNAENFKIFLQAGNENGGRRLFM